jgi:hypothetical protein
VPLLLALCKQCWLYENDPKYKALFDGQPIPELLPRPSGIDPECVKAAQREQAEPSLLRKAMNFAGAVVVHAVQGFPQATEQEVKRRVSICEVCEFFKVENRSCKQISCGCFIDTKATWLDQHCPIGKW